MTITDNHMHRWGRSLGEGYQDCTICARVRRDPGREAETADLYAQLSALVTAAEAVAIHVYHLHWPEHVREVIQGDVDALEIALTQARGAGA